MMAGLYVIVIARLCRAEKMGLSAKLDLDELYRGVSHRAPDP